MAAKGFRKTENTESSFFFLLFASSRRVWLVGNVVIRALCPRDWLGSAGCDRLMVVRMLGDERLPGGFCPPCSSISPISPPPQRGTQTLHGGATLAAFVLLLALESSKALRNRRRGAEELETKGRERALLPPSKTKAEVAALRAPGVLAAAADFFSTVAATFKFD